VISLFCLILLSMSFFLAQAGLGFSQAKEEVIQLSLVPGKNFGPLEVFFNGFVIETLRVPPAPLFIVVKNLEIPPGGKTIIFHSPQGPENIDARLGSGDKRDVSIAFGEFD